MLKLYKGLAAEFYYPQLNNDKESLAKEHRSFTRLIQEMGVGGYTDKGLASGVWCDEDCNVFRDNLVIYEVAGLSLEQIETLAKKIQRDANQLAVYLKIDGIAFHL